MTPNGMTALEQEFRVSLPYPSRSTVPLSIYRTPLAVTREVPRSRRSLHQRQSARQSIEESTDERRTVRYESVSLQPVRAYCKPRHFQRRAVDALRRGGLRLHQRQLGRRVRFTLGPARKTLIINLQISRALCVHRNAGAVGSHNGRLLAHAVGAQRGDRRRAQDGLRGQRAGE